MLTFVVFWLALYLKSRPTDPFYTQSLAETDAAFLAPTVTSIVLLLLLSGWAFAAVAFFFDRYRIPLFTIAMHRSADDGSVVAHRLPSADYEEGHGRSAINWRRPDRS